MCPCTHHGSMFHLMYSCSVFLPEGHSIYMSGETTRGPRSDPLTSTCCKLLPELRERKWPGGNNEGHHSMSALLWSAGEKKKTKQQTKQKFMTEIRLIWSLHWQKNMPFLLVVVVPFRSFWFVLLNCWVWSFPIIRAIPKHSYALCLCMWVLSPIPQRERHF